MRNVKLVTIDVWDTLIRRVCHPDAVKLHTCRFLLLTQYSSIKDEFRFTPALLNARRSAEGYIGQTHKSMGFDDEYQLREVYAHWLKLVLNYPTDLESIVEKLCEIELSQELLVSYPDPEIRKSLAQYPEAKKVFVSDFYMGVLELNKILSKAGYDGVISAGYSSCDIRLNKRSGNIFPFVLKREEIKAENVVHIGDNSHSDVSSPAKFGIKTIHYLPKEQHALRLATEKNFNNKSTIITSSLDTIANLGSLPNKDHKENSLYKYGIKSSPLLIGFVLNIMEQALTLGHERVFFFTREGEFFKKVYDTLAAEDPFGVPVPEAVILEVSRVATFSASLASASLNNLMRIWTLYSTQSMKALFSSLGVSIDSFSQRIGSHQISVEEEIQYPWLDERVKSLFMDDEFTNQLNLELSKKKEQLLAYLKFKNFPLSGKAAIVDIGWRGTIQDNLAHLLPDVNINGFYLGLDKFLNPQPTNTEKHAFGPNRNDPLQNDSLLFSKVAPIEMLCNSPNGSVTGYKKSGGIYLAEKLIQASENAIFHNAVTNYQEGVIHAAKKTGKLIRSHVISTDDIKVLAINCWTNIVDTPPAIIADTYFKLNHNESFGLGRFEDKSAIISRKTWIRAFFSIRGFKLLIRALESTGWPEGYLSQRNLLWLWKLTNKARKAKRKLNTLTRAGK